MIRFCDREVACVERSLLDKKELMSFFFRNGLDEIVCVYEKGVLVGSINYYDLVQYAEPESAICEDYMILKADQWQEARRLFAQHKAEFGEVISLPVVNGKGELICFAYEDGDANRELRMLRELMEKPEALQFQNVFPQYVCVHIYEFNELAYFFAKYLEWLGIPVWVHGELWEEIWENRIIKMPEYQCLKVYAEGTKTKSPNWIDNTLYTVSGEFEWIDTIYERNVTEGLISDRLGNLDWLLTLLKQADTVLMCGSGMEAMDACDFLYEKEIEVKGFINDQPTEWKHTLLGKWVMGTKEALLQYPDAIILEPFGTHSSWGFGGTDYYEYMGYLRGKRYFMLEDYVKIETSCLRHILQQKHTVLIGNEPLSKAIIRYHNKINDEKIDITYVGEHFIEETDEKYPKGTIVCIVEPDYAGHIQNKKRNPKKQIDCSFLQDYNKYFCRMEPFIKMESENKVREMPYKVVFGSIYGLSGNTFLRGIFDHHPEMMMIDYSFVNDNLFWLCCQLAQYPVGDILEQFWQIWQENETEKESVNRQLFDEKMYQLLWQKESVTSQELFIMIHIAYCYMYGQEIERKRVIYWEPHFCGPIGIDHLYYWLEDCLNCIKFHLVRNAIVRFGSVAKQIFLYENKGQLLSARWFEEIWWWMNVSYDERMLELKDHKLLVVRFEDVKLSPREVLGHVCEEIGMTWSEQLLRVTLHGERTVYDNGQRKVYDFDLKPVYNLYEEYVSNYDRFRNALLYAAWQRKYGYPYENPLSFTRKEINEMLLKEYKIEKFVRFAGDKDRMRTKKKIWWHMGQWIQQARREFLLNSPDKCL